MTNDKTSRYATAINALTDTIPLPSTSLLVLYVRYNPLLNHHYDATSHKNTT